MGLPALAADHLFIAPLIAARLAAEVSELPAEPVETVEQMLDADLREAVLLVMWAGDQFGDRAGGGKHQHMRQVWLVVLAMNNVGALPDARQVRAGPTLSAVHRALAAWVPEGAVNPLLRTTSPMRPNILKTKALYPVAFDIELSL